MKPDIYTWDFWDAVRCFSITAEHNPLQAPLIREIATEWDTEVCGLALSFAALKARETLNVN